MSVHAHIKALESKHAELKHRVVGETMRPFPDFTRITRMKKRKLAIKEEIYMLEVQNKFAEAS